MEWIVAIALAVGVFVLVAVFILRAKHRPGSVHGDFALTATNQRVVQTRVVRQDKVVMPGNDDRPTPPVRQPPISVPASMPGPSPTRCFKVGHEVFKDMSEARSFSPSGDAIAF